MRRFSLAVSVALCVLLAGFAVAPRLLAQDQSLLEDPLFEAYAKRGLAELYDMRYDEAAATFGFLAGRHPEHPVVPFLEGLVPWWRILADLGSTEHDNAFLAAMDRTIDRADRMLRRDDDNLDALFFKGAALGFRGRHHANRKNYLRAARDGQRALRYVLRVNEQSPDNPDFLFGIGIYDYFAVAVPERHAVARPFAAMFPPGDKGRGLSNLHRTYRHGSYIQTEAAYFLLQIYYLYERDYVKTLQFMEYLREQHPNNAFFHALEGRVLARFGHWDQAAEVWTDALSKVRRGQTGYNDSVAEQGHYYLALRAMRLRNYDRALTHFADLRRVAEQRDGTSAFVVLGRLREGMAHDANGDRPSAEAAYRDVLRLREVGTSRDRARRYLERPYRG
ncbi:MAG: hypothetical protein AAFN13_10405 [Bacteroidota bacterium]